MKLTPKIILEGTRLTHKTEIAFALNEHPQVVGARKYRYHSPIISAEWCGFTNHPWGRGLINFNLEEKDKALETYETWVKLFELQRYYSWIIDRFHISTQVVQQRLHHLDLDFRALEERLLTLNFRLIFLHRNPDSFEVARAKRLAISGNPAQYDDLQPFIEEQTQFHHYIQKSILPTLYLDISDDDIPKATNHIAQWLTETGGLGMPNE